MNPNMNPNINPIMFPAMAPQINPMMLTPAQQMNFLNSYMTYCQQMVMILIINIYIINFTKTI